jgi:pyruvyltransferase
MVSIVYCTREENKKHKEHLLKACGNPNVEIIEYVNNGESLTKFYNRGLNESKYNIVVFIHDDVIIESKQIANKIIRMFDKNPEYGIIGVAGTKYLSETGKWWDNPKTMYGKVAHTHEGKTWLSEYGQDQDKRLEETVVVDGVFFSVHKNRIKKQFDESVEGFHFYDIDFCFQNHLEGVKVGVTTEIRINHMSIGMTNDQWEINRQIFAEKYKENLPVKINETFEHRKLKVLIGCLSFSELTGSELLTLETAKGLSERNCEVSVVSASISDKFKHICKKYGIKTYTINEPPHYKLGDGEWYINTPNGPQQTQKNILYRVNQETFDIIHVNHTPITERLLKLYPESNFVNTVGSEIIDLENPVIDEKIKKYIAVRPTIKDYLINEYKIDDDDIEIIYNPINNNRFKHIKLPSGTNKKVTLFVGTMDFLREKPINDLVNRCEKDDKELWLVGKDTMGYGKNISNTKEHVKYFEPTDNIEEFYYKCDETCGIMLGRTTIEGFLCGKPGIIYNVDKYGEIIGCTYNEVPKDLSIFKYDYNINKIKKVYIDVFNLNNGISFKFNNRVIRPDNTKNWGDLIPFKIINELFDDTNLTYGDVFNVKNPYKKYKVYSTGSIMKYTNKESIVWGSGCIDINSIGENPLKVFSVRGPLTRNELLKRGIDCPEIYGDPALLYPKIYNPKIEKKYKWGLIPHYIDFESANDRKIIKHFENLGFKIIDICKGENEFIDELLEVEYILSSSLHGLIASDAYGIPNARVSISNKLIGGDFKFIDYYKSVGRKQLNTIFINKNTTMGDVDKIELNFNIEFDEKKLLNSAPWELKI